MAEVLFGQSYFLRFDPKLWEAMQPYPPLGALYAASWLRSLGREVALFDAMLAESTAEWESCLDRHSPKFAVLYEDSFNYLSKMCLLRMRRAAFEMIGQAKQRGAVVIVSASDATDNLEDYFSHGADYVLIGEGEHVLSELLETLEGEGAGAAPLLPGVAARGGDKLPSVPRRPSRDLDRLPFPAWDLVDLERYRRVWRERHGFFSINLVTTRGCPYRCNWCAKPIFGQRYNARSPENVVEEMALLSRMAAPDHIWFADDIFGLKKGWIERFADLVQDRDLRTPFKCLQRSDLINPSNAEALQRAGCRTVWLGAESGSQKILDAMDKGATVEDCLRATSLLRGQGIEVGFFLQFGYPGEEWDDILKTVRMVRRSMPDDIGISVSYPLPGTKFHERVRKDLGLKRNWDDGNDLAMLYQGPFTTGFYRQVHKTLHKEYRARKALKKAMRGESANLKPLLRAASLPWDWAKLQWMRRTHATRA